MAQRIEDETYSLAVINERAAQAQAVWDKLKVGLDGNILKAPFEKFLKEDFRDGRSFSLVWLKQNDETVAVPCQETLAFLEQFVSESDFQKLSDRIARGVIEWRTIDGATWRLDPKKLADTKIKDLPLEEIRMGSENRIETTNLVFRVRLSAGGSQES